MEQLVQRIGDLERLVRETRESQVRLETVLTSRPAPGEGQTCKWHDAQIEALRDFDSSLAAKVSTLAETDLVRHATSRVWAIVGRTTVAAGGGVFALLGQWIMEKIV